ncbi:hypothetical protein B0O99DRAFT_688456 [Bisporella sp. PMI_857]|nr:hypothetical protein B0O99DRAFT_688456 [Bisporella sp. PMI_857]
MSKREPGYFVDQKPLIQVHLDTKPSEPTNNKNRTRMSESRDSISNIITIKKRSQKLHADYCGSAKETKAISVPEPVPVLNLPRALSPLSFNSIAMNASSISPSNEPSLTGTIRSVPTGPSHLDVDPSRRAQTHSDPMPHATIRQSATHPSLASSSQPPLAQQNGSPRTIASEFMTTRSFNTGNLSQDPTTSSPTPNNGQWSSAVGGANLGKSGRVIEKLMAENDTLKRTLNIEKTKAEEAVQQRNHMKTLLEQKDQAFETEQQKCANFEVSLRRKDRAYNDLKVKIVAARLQTAQAQDDELKWREMCQKIEKETKESVEDANSRAAMHEVRVNTMSAHWRDQQALIDGQVVKIRKEVQDHLKAKEEDNERIKMLVATCDQQAKEVEKLLAHNAAILVAHEEYKRSQEELLKDIKRRARYAEETMSRDLEDSKKVLGELRWALNVKKTIPDAQ